MIDPRWVSGLPGGEPDRQLLDPAESAGGLGQLCLARSRQCARLKVRTWQLRRKRADLMEVCYRFGHRPTPLGGVGDGVGSTPLTQAEKTLTLRGRVIVEA